MRRKWFKDLFGHIIWPISYGPYDIDHNDIEPIKASDDEFDESLDADYLSQVIRS